MKKGKKHVAILLVCSMILSLFSSSFAFADAGSGTKLISSSEDFPATISEGEVYVLANDIILNAGQQIDKLAGTLDGQGYSITLADKPLAGEVSGTIQNLGVKSSQTVSVSGVSGSMAVKLTGTIQNCYSTVNLTTSGWDDVGGLVGTMTGGTLRNSYHAGTNGAMFADGLIGVNHSSTSVISDCYYTTGYSPIGMNSPKATPVNCAKKTAAELKSGEIIQLLNNHLTETGYYFALPTDGSNDGLPILKAGSLGDLGVDKSSLEADVKAAKELVESAYTAESWSTFATALASAETVLQDEAATQKQIDDAISALSAAKSGLEKKKPTEAVAPPADETNITHIKTVADLEKIKVSDENGYYVLDNDLTITYNDWYMPFGDFCGVFDGQGHTITFDGRYGGLFENVGATGVLQNTAFSGNMASGHGPAGKLLKGAIINCYTKVAGDTATGFVNRLQGGLISNCYSISPAKGGAIVTEYSVDKGYTGTLLNTYWGKGLVNVDFPADALQGGSAAMSDADMQTKDFVACLNSNKGTNGVSWGQGSDGYPYFGEDQAYEEEKPEISENKYTVLFTPKEGSETKLFTQALNLALDDTDAFGHAGTFRLEGVPTDSKIDWACNGTAPDRAIMIGAETGELYIYENGTTTLTATEIKGDGTTELAATIVITATEKQIEDIKLFINDKDVTNDRATVEGSAWTDIVVKAKYEGSTEYVDALAKRFTFSSSDETLIQSGTSSGSFYFKQPGTGTMTVSAVANPEVKATVEVTSTFVAVTSVKPAISGTFVIHGRNANSSSGTDFLPEYTSVIVEPENASNRNNFTVTSSDDAIARYVDSMVKGYVPYKAGTVTYTAIIEDSNPLTGSTNKVTGTSQVTYLYQNPLTILSSGETSIALPAGTNEKLDLEFVGEKSAEGYSVTEPELVWTFDQEGIVKISRKTEIERKDIEGAPDDKLFLPTTDYYVYALSEGTVTATGTPVDNTNGVEPVTIKITVTKGDAKPVDVDNIVNKGVAAATDYLLAQLPEKPEYGYEWHIYTLLRAGVEIPAETLGAYYDSICAEVQKWNEREKPTDIARVMLTLSIMGKDVTDVAGVDLVDMLCNSFRLTGGSNELAYALLALDAKSVEVPADAAYDRETMMKELLTFQNEDGGFSLFKDGDSGIDATGYVLQALAPYVDKNEDVKAAVECALAYLQSQMTPEYTFDGTSEAVSQVIIALTALGMDPTSPSTGFGTQYGNLFSGLMKYYSEDPAGFVHVLDQTVNNMATIQAMQALDSYRHFVEDAVSYWDLNEVEAPEVIVPEDDNDDSTLPNDDENQDDMDQTTGKEDGTEAEKDSNVEESDEGEESPATGDDTVIVQWMLLVLTATVLLINKKNSIIKK